MFYDPSSYSDKHTHRQLETTKIVHWNIESSDRVNWMICSIYQYDKKIKNFET